MNATGWNNGANVYGLRITIADRKVHFECPCEELKARWEQVEIDIDGQTHLFRLTRSFWKDCPEIRDYKTPVLHDWLKRKFRLPWSVQSPPEAELTPLGDNRFRLSARDAKETAASR
jgi:hypothetical protein